MRMNVITSYKERVKSIFTKKPDYQALYLNEQKESEKWEYKYNKLYPLFFASRAIRLTLATV